ncbi:MAG: hypothetical protein WCA37_00970 [Terracidiphilus sp.]
MADVAILQSSDLLQYFSWWIYVDVGVVYSALILRGEISKEGALIFSKKNARSLSWIFTIHLTFLAILFGLMRIIPRIYPSLPKWMTDLFNGRGSAVSALDLTFILTMLALHFIERRWLYTESEADFGNDAPMASQNSRTGRHS